MKRTGFFINWMVPVAVVIVLAGNHAARSEESPAPSVADTHPAPDHAVSESVLPAAEDAGSSYEELVRLIQAGVDQSVILTYIEKSLRFFNLDAERIIYLTDLGTPSAVIEAVMERDEQLLQEGMSPAPSASEAETMTNPPEVTEDYLYDTLSPYGSWIYIEGYGRCWQPAVVTQHSGWRPYCDNGRWIYTDCGWYWMSDYRWGWAAFHYGRWFRHVRYGWCWWPDTVWSPSWVSWRYDRTYCGWAPLPPYTSCRSGTGMMYRGNRVSVGFNFGLDSDCYTFIATRYFCDPMPGQHYVDRRDAKKIYDRTRPFNRIDYDVRKKSVVNGGVSPDIISRLSRQTITPVSVRHAASRAGNNGRHEQLNRNARTLVVSRPPHSVTQGRRTPARIQSGTTQGHPSQQNRTYAATANRTSRTSGSGTMHPSAVRGQSMKPSGTRQPTPAPQARPHQSTTPSGGRSAYQPAAPQSSSPQQGNRGHAGTKGAHSTGNAYGRGQANKPANPGRSNGANGKP